MKIASAVVVFVAYFGISAFGLSSALCQEKQKALVAGLPKYTKWGGTPQDYAYTDTKGLVTTLKDTSLDATAFIQVKDKVVNKTYLMRFDLTYIDAADEIKAKEGGNFYKGFVYEFKSQALTTTDPVLFTVPERGK